MKLASVFFDDTVCIPGAKDVGGGVYQDLRDSSFHAADGWDIDWDGHVLFTLWREGMASVAKVGGYGFTFIAETAAGTTRMLGAATVTSIDGDGANTVTLTDASAANTFVPATQEQHEAMGLRPKRRRK